MAAHRAVAAVLALRFHRLAPQYVSKIRLATDRTHGRKRHHPPATIRAVEADFSFIEGSGQWLAAAWTGYVHGMDSVTIVLMDYRNITQETPLFQSQQVNTGLVCLKNRQKRYNKK